jgi:hypothetical protein
MSTVPSPIVSANLAPFGLVLVMMARVGLAAQLPSPQEWSQADAATRRLTPSELGDVPQPVRAELDRRGCTIPQVYTGGRPHNAVRGQFRRAGQIDIAVLCSRARTSAILVFWAGDPRTVSEIAPRPDEDFLQVVAPGRIGFSRAIGVASPEFIRERSRQYGGSLPPSLTHDGINDAFVEKASIVWYWRDGKWLQLTGSD